MDRRVTPPKRVTSPIWGPPPQCEQARSSPYAVRILYDSDFIRIAFKLKVIQYYFTEFVAYK